MWYDFFDSIHLINLPERRDRYWISTWELARYKLPYQVVRAVKHPDGRQGLYSTIRQIFEKAVASGAKRILVFEDDIKFLLDPEPLMDRCLQQLPENFDLLYLGCNLAARPREFYSPNLIPVTRALSTHAVAYSRACMERILSMPYILPIDLFYAQTIQAAGRSFSVCPLLVSQHPGYSNIEKKNTDWTNVLDRRFLAQIDPLLKQCADANEECCRS